MSSNSDHPRLISAFLSHKYSASDVNLFFYELISTDATIIFRIDRGKLRTSTTRLERMIRDADAFVGVWSLPGEPDVAWNRDALAAESRYFRLELDMAIRARKLGIVFSDRRYANLLQVPARMLHLQYDAQEVRLSTSSPSWARLQAKVRAFWRGIDVQLTSRAIAAPFVDEGRVGVLLGRYNDVDAAGVAEEAVLCLNCNPVRLPNRLSVAHLGELQRCDWVIADVADPAIETITAFLHGQFVPILRVRHVSGGAARSSAVEDVLFGDLTVGYRKDVTHWTTETELRDGLHERLDVIVQQAKLIGDQAAAIAYFSSAAKRKDPVFLSYAGEDADRAAEFAAELRRRFQEVFDYRDSMRFGEYWQDQLSHRLTKSAIGVILFSQHYRESSYCMDEARHLYDGFMNGQAKLLPVKLDDASVPDLLSGLQYARLSRYSPAEIVERFTRQLG
jgi:hypothetical protein